LDHGFYVLVNKGAGDKVLDHNTTSGKSLMELHGEHQGTNQQWDVVIVSKQ
jgi:hypothetical protein